MSTVQLTTATVYARSAETNKPAEHAYGQLTIGGVLTFLSGILIYGSAFAWMRPNIGGLLLQPCLVPLVLAAPIGLYLWINRFPSLVLAGLVVFCGMYSFSAMGESISLSEIAKVWSAMLMIVMPAILIKTRTDLIAGVLGFTIAMGILGIYGLQSGDQSEGINPMEVANKNSYSVYALPAILLAGSLIIKLKNLPNVVRAILAICSLIASVTILLSGNRSGWLGVVVVGALLIKDRKFVGLLLVLIFTAAAVLFMTQFGDTTVAERRLMDTQSGRTSDNMRIWLLRTCVQIGLENPLLGVSPQGLPYELGRRYEETTRMNIVDSHNVFGHILGGSGLICFAALMLSGWGIWRFPRANPNFPGPQGLFLRHAAATLHSMIILWVVRGMFSREILYNPGACLGLGLAIGWCIVESTNLTMRNRQPTAAWQ